MVAGAGAAHLDGVARQHLVLGKVVGSVRNASELDGGVGDVAGLDGEVAQVAGLAGGLGVSGTCLVTLTVGVLHHGHNVCPAIDVLQ